jgi:hypothetical protein
VADAFFLPIGDGRYAATEHTSGPWAPGAQHAGPPSALLARAIEQTPGDWPGILTRITVDLLGPVPVAELDVTSTVLRKGRSVELVQAELAHDGRVAARGTGWRIRRADHELPSTATEQPIPVEETVPPFPDAVLDLPDEWRGGYIRAMEWREAHGRWTEPGPAKIWGRMLHPLVAGEEPTGLQRVLTIADSGNGASSVLPMNWFFINTDLTVHLAAEPVGEWICLDAATRLDGSGFGLASSRLFDRDKLVARGAQALYIGPR